MTIQHKNHGISRPCSCWDIIIVAEGLQCANCLELDDNNTIPSESNYAEGYRNGRDDRSLGCSPMVSVLTSMLAGYSRGYWDGYREAGETIEKATQIDPGIDSKLTPN